MKKKNTRLNYVQVELWIVTPWRWRQQGPPKSWYPITTLYGVTTRKTSVRLFTAVKTSNLKLHATSRHCTPISWLEKLNFQPYAIITRHSAIYYMSQSQLNRED